MKLNDLIDKDPRDLVSMGRVLGVQLHESQSLIDILYPLLHEISKKEKLNFFEVEGIVQSTGEKKTDYSRDSRNESGRLWVDVGSDDGEYVELRIPPKFIAEFGLRVGDIITGTMFPPENERPLTVRSVTTINGKPGEIAGHRRSFERLRTSFPKRRISLERKNAGKMKSVGRLIDIVSPLGFGQRALVVAPPRTGKTVLLSEIAKSVRANHPETELMVLLIDERPEEVAYMRSSVDCPIFFSTFDKSPDQHVKLAELVIERAKRLVEQGKDVVVVMDSLTRLARAYNTLQPNSGKILTGGVDAASLDKPKKLFGAARAFDEGGSLTIVATALVDTGSRADQVHYEELKGTGSCEIVLDRRLSEKGVYPAIDVSASGTRMDDELYSEHEKRLIDMIRKYVKTRHEATATEWLIEKINKTESNAELIRWVNEQIVRQATAPISSETSSHVKATPQVREGIRDRGPARPMPGGPSGYVRSKVL